MTNCSRQKSTSLTSAPLSSSVKMAQK